MERKSIQVLRADGQLETIFSDELPELITSIADEFLRHAVATVWLLVENTGISKYAGFVQKNQSYVDLIWRDCTCDISSLTKVFNEISNYIRTHPENTTCLINDVKFYKKLCPENSKSMFANALLVRISEPSCVSKRALHYKNCTAEGAGEINKRMALKSINTYTEEIRYISDDDLSGVVLPATLYSSLTFDPQIAKAFKSFCDHTRNPLEDSTLMFVSSDKIVDNGTTHELAVLTTGKLQWKELRLMDYMRLKKVATGFGCGMVVTMDFETGVLNLSLTIEKTASTNSGVRKRKTTRDETDLSPEEQAAALMIMKLLRKKQKTAD